MEAYNRILFVDQDNTCRSIMAEAVMRRALREQRPEVGSRGLVVLFPEPLNPRAAEVLQAAGLEPAKTESEGLTAADAQPGTLFLTMTDWETEQVKERLGDGVAAAALGAFTGQPGDIQIPYGGTQEHYEACFEYIDLLVKVAAEIILR